MAKITKEMKEMIEKAKTPAIATATRGGKPNVIPIGFTQVISENEILLMDNYMNKTRANIEDNPLVAISVWNIDESMGYQFKGTATIETHGILFENSIEWVKSKRPQTTPKAAIVVKIDEIYLIGPGDEAGKRIA